MRGRRIVVGVGVLVALAGGIETAVVLSHAQGTGAARGGTGSAEIKGRWAMTPDGDTVPSEIGAEPITLHGRWRSTSGVVGTAVEFPGGKTGYGLAEGTEDDNAGTADFAMAMTFTSQPAVPDVGFSGNMMQKGRANKLGQVKLSTLPTKVGGATFCRVKGTSGFRILKSKVVIDDGDFHTAVCWREGGTIGLTVDGETVSTDFDPGDILTDEPVRIGNQAAEGNLTDQHLGINDCAVWVVGTGARQLAADSTPC